MGVWHQPEGSQSQPNLAATQQKAEDIKRYFAAFAHEF
jgi:hypothetical protein